MISTTTLQDEIPRLKEKVYFLRVSGHSHNAVKKLAKELGIGMDKLSDMLIERSIKTVHDEATVNIKVRRLKDGSTDMKLQ
jgi:hypothetical protein